MWRHGSSPLPLPFLSVCPSFGGVVLNYNVLFPPVSQPTAAWAPPCSWTIWTISRMDSTSLCRSPSPRSRPCTALLRRRSLSCTRGPTSKPQVSCTLGPISSTECSSCTRGLTRRKQWVKILFINLWPRVKKTPLRWLYSCVNFRYCNGSLKLVTEKWSVIELMWQKPEPVV